MNKKIKVSIGLLAALSSLASAAEITWQAPVNMFSGDPNNASFVSARGTLVDAVNGGGVDTTVNGTLFTGLVGTQTGGQNLTSGSFSFANHNDNPNAFGEGEFAGGTAGVGALIQSGLWAVDSVTMAGLTIGDEYEIQLLGNDARGNRSDNYMIAVGDGVNSLVPDTIGILNNQPNAAGDGPEGTGGPTGQFFIGTFVADAATQTFEIFGTNSGTIADLVLGNSRAHVNAIQLRSLPPDADGDGMSNTYEDANGLDRNDPDDAEFDPDEDGLSNLREFQRGTDLNDDDTDDDTLLDGDEVDIHGTNPLLADTDGDDLTDSEELALIPAATNPLAADSDLDSLNDGEEANVQLTDPNNPDSDFDGINDGTEVLISMTDPNDGGVVPTLDPAAVDILAYWDFNDDSNAALTTDLVNSYEGDLNEGTTYSADALGHTEQAGDKAIYLGAVPDSGTGVTVELGEFFNLASINDQMTISFWQKLDAGEPTAATSSVGASRYGVDRAIMAHLPFTDGNIYFDHGGGAANRVSGTPISPVDWQQWNHITLVKDVDTKQVWINGSLAIEGENVSVVENNHHTILLGTDDLDRNAVGHVDDFAFYADALTSTQILALSDGTDPRFLDAVLDDTDGDGMPDFYETFYGLNPGVNDAGDDLDSDDLTNLEEFVLGTLPNNDDTDGDEYTDGAETGTGAWENASDTGTDPFLTDSDGDGLLDGVENPDLPFVDADQTGTDPNIVDSDGDSYSDGAEIAFGSDPTDPLSWAIDIPEVVLYYDFNGNTLSRIDGAPDATLTGPAVLSADAGGFSESAGDQSLDLGTTAGAGAYAAVVEGDHLAIIETNNTVAISWRQRRTGPTIQSAAFAAPNTANGRGLQSHSPWSNGQFFVDLMGFRQTVADPTIADQWQHFVIQQSVDGTVELFVDGAVAGSWPQGAAAQMFSLTGAVNIGATLDGTNNMTGQLDDFAILSGPIPLAHIQRLAGGESIGDVYLAEPEFRITDYSRDGDIVTLTWDSDQSVTEGYTVRYSFDLQNWDSDLGDGLPADPGSQTTETFDISLFGIENAPRVYFRVEK